MGSGTFAAPPDQLTILIHTTREPRMAMQVRSSGCMFSIIASIVLTIVLNLALRGCSGGTAGW